MIDLRSVLTVVVLAMSMPVAQAQIRVGLSGTSDETRSGTYVWARAFAHMLDESGMEVRLYPSSSIGAEIVRTEQVLLGLLEVNITGGQEVEMLSELFKGLELPFLFESSEQMELLLNRTDFLSQVNRETIPHGMRVVGFAYTGGMEGLFTVGQAVRSPGDLGQLRLRAMTSQQLAYFDAWGGAGTQVAWEEVPQALQTGIAHGYLNPPIVAVMFGHGGQLDFFTDLNLSPSMRTVVVSESWYQALDEDQREVVDMAIGYASAVNREWNRRMMSSEFELLRESGIEVVELTREQRERFRERLLPLYDGLVSIEVRREIERFAALAGVKQ